MTPQPTPTGLWTVTCPRCGWTGVGATSEIAQSMGETHAKMHGRAVAEALGAA